jgi:two-component system, sensor histidine kinase
MPKTVLIVEDYADVRMMMKILVHRYGYDVIEAGDGREALEKTKQFHPDLILMDISMPIMDGLSATQIIRTLDVGAKIPILAVTAFGNSYHKKAIEAGCNDVIQKPLDFDALEPLLRQYLPETA